MFRSTLAVLTLLFTATQAGAETSVAFDLPAQSLADALVAVANKTDINVYVDRKLVGNRRVSPLKAQLTADEAFTRLLVGTGLRHRFLNEHTVVVAEDEPAGSAAEGATSSNSATHVPSESLRLVMADAATAVSQDSATALSERPESAAELVVTGSHLRGVEPAGAPVLVYDRERIEMSGYTTLEGFMATVTQNNPLNADGGPMSANQSSQLNLRGLGEDSSLMLVNGRRMAPADIWGGVDIGSIPLELVERIEILTDGASALYGSDAVGGVVNFVLRDDLQGAETTLRLSETSRGDGGQINLSQAFGTHWNTGNVLVNYVYDGQDPIGTEAREATRGTQPQPSQLVADITEHSGMLRLNQGVSERIELFADTFFNDRDVQRATSGLFTASAVRQYGLAGGAVIALPKDWSANVTLSGNEYSGKTTINSQSGGSRRLDEFSVQLLETVLDGPVFGVWGGEAKLAVGAQARNEDLVSHLVQNSGAVIRDDMGDRSVIAGFGELYVPLVGPGNDVPGIRGLDFSIAGRYERYSDFGSEFVPKVGVAWAPVDGLKVRGTWGRSFRAPQLKEILDRGKIILVRATPQSDPLSPSGTTMGISYRGSVDDLQPESSSNLTLGVDFAPAAIPGLDAALTYFDIDFVERISASGANLEQEAVYASFITRRPDAATDPAGAAAFQARVDALMSLPLPTFITDLSGGAPIDVIVDARTTNLSATRNRGLDFDLSYGFDTGLGYFSASIGGTYILDLGTRPVAGVAYVDQYNRYGAPVNLRLRNRLSWRRDNLSANVLIHHVDSYIDGRAGVAGTVGSWTTADLTFRYLLPHGGWLSGTNVSVSAVNLFDRDPPVTVSTFASSPTFDGRNASVLGRRISLRFTKAWGAAPR